MTKSLVKVVVLTMLMTTFAMGGAVAANVIVPNVIGLPKTAPYGHPGDPNATATLAGVGLGIGTVGYGSSTDQPVDIIYRQSPAAGTSVASGTAVNIVIAQSPSPFKKDPVWPWGKNPSNVPPRGQTPVMSFCQALQAIMDNPLLHADPPIIPPEYQSLFDSLSPETVDINGSSHVILEDPYPDGDPSFELGGNGKNDCVVELRLVGEVLGNTTFNIPAHDTYTGLTHAKVLRALNLNAEQAEQDVGSAGLYSWGTLASMVNGLPQVLTGYMLVGDGDATVSDYHWTTDTPPVWKPNRVDCTGAAGFIKAVMFLLGDNVVNSQIDLNSYARMPEFFAMAGDADGDGVSNDCEYAYAHDSAAFPTLTTEDQKLEKYVEIALNPAKSPPLPTEPGVPDYCGVTHPLKLVSQTGGGTVRDGSTLTLSMGVLFGSGNITYAWTKDTIPMSDVTNIYTKDSVTIDDDSGTYVCTATDEAKTVVSARWTVSVVDPSLLPVATPIALGALIGMLFGGGGLVMLRKRG